MKLCLTHGTPSLAPVDVHPKLALSETDFLNFTLSVCPISTASRPNRQTTRQKSTTDCVCHMIF